MNFRHIITLCMLIIMQSTFSFGQSSSTGSNEQSSNTYSSSLSNGKGKAKKVKPILRKRTPTLAILPLTNANPVSRKVGYGNSIASMLQTQIRNQTNFLVLERSQLGEILNEKSLAGMGLTRKERMDLEKIHSVEVLMLGEVSELGELIQIDVRLVSVKTGKVVVAEFIEVKNLSNLRNKITELAKTIELKYLRQWIGSLEIGVAPVEGEVYLDGAFIGKASQKKSLKLDKLLEGDYHLKIIAGGYEQYEEVVHISAKTQVKKSIPLKSLPGSLKIESRPVGAEVWINETMMGKTPLKLKDLSKGQYFVVLKSDQYQNFRKQVTILPGNTSEVRATLKVVPGSIYLSSLPKGATVHLNGTLVGRTPLLLENIIPGTYNALIEKDDYQEVSQTVVVRPSERHQVTASLEKQMGKMTIVNDLEECTAQVYRGDSLIDSFALPIHKKELEIGSYRVEVKRPSYFPIIKNVNIINKQESRLEVSMVKKPGTLQIKQTRLHAADMYYDGEYQGKVSERSQELKEGQYEILVDDFFHTQKQSVTIEADKKTELELESKDNSPHKLVIPVVTAFFVTLLFFI